MRKNRGFTLVELLVVISIVAILATVGMAVFGGAQKNARDGKRISDLDTIAKSLESSKDFTANSYVNGLSADFPNGIPADPKPETTNYCICTSTEQGKIDAPAAWGSGCPATACGTSNWMTVSGTAFEASTKSWTVCTVKENGSSVECKYSLQQ